MIRPHRAWGTVALLAWAATVSDPRAGGQEPSAPAYRLGPKDVLEIKVFEVPELNVELRVSEEGSITLPLVGEVYVEGLTDHELRDSLTTLLESRYVQRATVSVTLVEFRSRPITVMGAVQKPGPLAFSGRWTLLETIAAAGGLTADHGSVIYVLRRADNGLSDQVAVRVDDLLVRGERRANIPIFPNDLINVPPRVQVTIYCLGEVNGRGAVQFESTERITLLTAIARAGGLSERASRKVLIRRRNGEELEADYRRVVSGKDPDPELEDGDVLVVKESFF